MTMNAFATAATEERIGKYRVHPVAAMFPLIEGDEYEDLRGSIEVFGQLKAITVQGDVLLDGRNRLRACLELQIEPKVIEYKGRLDPVRYITAANIERRHLDADARSLICAQIQRWEFEQRNAKKQQEARTAQGEHGAEGGRGHKKPFTMNSSSRVSEPEPGPGPGPEPKTRARDARSTVGQIATSAKVSHHKAAQAVAVEKAVSSGSAPPDLLEQVKTGAVKLKDAFAQVKAAAPAKPKREAKPRKFNLEVEIKKLVRQTQTSLANCPVGERKTFKAGLGKEMKRLCES
jgi:hypothetical protein